MYLGYNDQKDTEINTLESLKFEGGWQFLWIVNFLQDIQFCAYTSMVNELNKCEFMVKADR